VNLVVMVVLVGVWAAVLLPPAIRSRSNGRPSDSIGSFNRHMSVLSRTAPGGSPSRPSRPALTGPGAMGPALRSRPLSRTSATQRRRRDILVVLLGSVAVTSLAALVLRGPFLFVALVCWAALLGYVALLVRLKHSVAERSMSRDVLAGEPTAARPARSVRPAHALDDFDGFGELGDRHDYDDGIDLVDSRR
jgi:hypothetical protein